MSDERLLLAEPLLSTTTYTTYDILQPYDWVDWEGDQL
jgi:hypothetical protein